MQAPIQTFGAGARGCNLYDGTLQQASFTNIATHGEGSVGVQVSKPLPVLDIAGDLTTEGGEGQSLVKGVQVTLKAVALSVKPSGALDRITVGGQIRTSGDDVVTVEIDGNVGELVAAGGIFAYGPQLGRDPYRRPSLALDHLTVRAEHGQEIILTG